MRELDDELRHVLRRESPPAGFAERVAQRAAHGQSPPRRLTRWLAAAALVAAIAGGLVSRRSLRVLPSSSSDTRYGVPS